MNDISLISGKSSNFYEAGSNNTKSCIAISDCNGCLDNVLTHGALILVATFPACCPIIW